MFCLTILFLLTMAKNEQVITGNNTRALNSLSHLLLNQPYQNIEVPLQSIAEIFAVIVGIKPTTMRNFKLSSRNFTKLQQLLRSLQLEFITEKVISTENKPSYDIFIGKDQKNIYQTQKALHALQTLFKTTCELHKDPNFINLTSKVGQLLGYPKTATEYFIHGPLNSKGIVNHRPNAEHDRYYIHSPTHFIEEYNQFEDILHPLFLKACPDIAILMQQNPTKYWSSADFH